ncbi:MAG: hypothetical protein REI78_12175 [Pedobacter sp.]|nr:hypothetical protein [Pedobacter sp.]MDQ8053780.1 hypothetical protein [Pedobacter sp.]
MKKIANSQITDQYLESLDGIRPAEPKAFFYDRLIDRLANEQQEDQWSFPLRPTWMIASLTILLIVNTLILLRKDHRTTDRSQATIESFANAYDLQISTY